MKPRIAKRISLAKLIRDENHHRHRRRFAPERLLDKAWVFIANSGHNAHIENTAPRLVNGVVGFVRRNLSGSASRLKPAP